MRIVAGRWRGRRIEAPAAAATRPTADRVRQALFDMLAHAPWAGPWPPARVLDAFAGSGALGLEALSRGAGEAIFFETDRAARATLRANIAALGASGQCSLFAADVTRPTPRAPPGGCDLLLLDPPYRQGLVERALASLEAGGWIGPGALIIAETAADEPPPVPPDRLLQQRRHGAALLCAWRSSVPIGAGGRVVLS